MLELGSSVPILMRATSSCSSLWNASRHHQGVLSGSAETTPVKGRCGKKQGQHLGDQVVPQIENVVHVLGDPVKRGGEGPYRV